MHTFLLRWLGAGSLAGVLAIASIGCASASPDDDADTTEGALGSSFVARGTGYYPASNALEGGFTDRRGAKLRTLQQFLAGNASYVSVAMDANAFPYGQQLRIHELEAKYGRAIPFRVVDTGGAFRGKGRSRIDICTSSKSAASDPTINGTLHIDVVGTSSGSSSQTPTAPSQPSQPSQSSGTSCSSTGDCNPGSDGSGMICVGGQCVEGCTANWQCPGSTTCSGGHCR